MSKLEEVKKIEDELHSILDQIRTANDIPRMLKLNERVKELNDQLNAISAGVDDDLKAILPTDDVDQSEPSR